MDILSIIKKHWIISTIIGISIIGSIQNLIMQDQGLEKTGIVEKNRDINPLEEITQKKSLVNIKELLGKSFNEIKEKIGEPDKLENRNEKNTAYWYFGEFYFRGDFNNDEEPIYTFFASTDIDGYKTQNEYIETFGLSELRKNEFQPAGEDPRITGYTIGREAEEIYSKNRFK